MLRSAAATVDARTTRFVVLRFMRDQALANRGWRRRAVRGWHSCDEVQAATGVYLLDMLPRLATQGRVDRVDIREPGRARPQWLYRISVAGLSALSAWEGTELPSAWRTPEDPDPDAGALYVPVRAWEALEILRSYAQAEVGPRRWGAHGWMNALEITRVGPPLLCNDELPWLIARRLVERRCARVEGRQRPAYFYRPTALGMAAVLVDAARAGTAAPTHVQLAVCSARPSAREAEAAWAPVVTGETRAEGAQAADLGPGVDGMDTVDSRRASAE